MTTFTAFTRLDALERAEALGLALEEMEPEPTGVGVFEIEDGSGQFEVGAYFEAAPDAGGLALLAAAFGAAPFVVSEVPETDWVAKVRRDLSPVEAGRFFVHGSHDAGNVPEGRVALLIEAAMAFGTGHHGTTKGCLLAFERLLEAGAARGPVADVGCGTAVLAMAAARTMEAVVVAGDIDAVAVEVAEANLAANGLSGAVTAVEATGFDHPAITGAAPFGLVFANILKGPLIELAPDMARYVAEGGHAILSGILLEQAEEVAGHYARNGFNLTNRIDIGDWSCLVLRKITL